MPDTENTTLVIMAAGRGRRFGGLKQLAGFGPGGQRLLDYTLHDARRTGIDRAVLVVSAETEAEFARQVAQPWSGALDVELAVQRLEDLPVLPVSGAGPAARQKPWGTGQALWAARHLVTGPCLVANADDFYGRKAIHAVAGFLRGGQGPDRFVLQGYELRDTLPGEGGFSRGLCQVDAGGFLTGITERLDVERRHAPDRGQPVSMNLWGFTPAVFPLLADGFVDFLTGSGHDPQQEFYLPAAVQRGIDQGLCRVRVLPALGGWMGVTTPEDADRVRTRLARLHDDGIYPEDLTA